MEWKPIEGYKFQYRISETTRVQKFDNGKWVDLKHHFQGGRTRLSVNLVDANGKKVRVPIVWLVADAFLGGRRPGYNIVHKNGMKTDCAPENLVFMTKQETGKKFGTLTRKTVLKVDANGEVLCVYPCVHSAAVDNYMSESSVKTRCQGKIKYPFRYDDFTFVYDD